MQDDAFAALVAAAKDGSDSAWTELLGPVAPKLVGYLRLRGSKDPEAAAGDVFVDVARRLGSFTGGRENFASWVFVIAHRRVIDEYRRDQVRPDEVHTEKPVEGGAVSSAEEEALLTLSGEAVADLLSDLTGPQRDAIYLRVVADLSVEETAKVMNRPVTSVKALQRRGLATLRRRIEDKGVSR
jgi:RNA polymerase sigma-70 factor (ECF subfamily)